MSGDIDLYNISDVCRLCLKCDGTILPIFGLEHSSRDCIPLSCKIKACVSVEISKNDELPKKICVGCVHQVDSWHKFKTVCDNSQTKLKSWFKPQNASRASQQIQGEVKQEFVDIEDNDVICCDDALDNDFNQDVSMPMPDCDVIVVEDDIDDNDVVMENDDASDEEDVVVSTTENLSIDKRQNNRISDESENVAYNKDCDNTVNKSPSDTSGDLLTSVDKSSGGVDSTTDIVIESVKSRIGGKKSSDKQLDDNSLKLKENEQSTSNGSCASDNNGGIITEEQRMLADFHDELAPDLKLSPNKVLESQVNGIDVNNEQNNETCSTNSNKEDSETSIKVLKDKSSTIIDRISSEINRRLSSDDNLNIDYSNIVINGRNTSESDRNDNDSISNNDVDDSASMVNEEEEEEEEEEVVIEKRELRPRTRNQTSLDSAQNGSESGIVIVEGFSLSDYNSQVTNDVRRLHHHNAGNHDSSGPDLEMLGSFDSAHPNLEMLYNIKQEPPSPTAGNSSDINIKKEVDDWASMPSEPIDIKPDITLLEGFGEDVADLKGKRRKYPQFKNGIPCEPCKASFPNYVKWIRHTKSHKHQRNVAFYDINRRSTQGSDAANPMLPSVQNFIRPNFKLPLLAENRQNPCPIGGCQASFKHRRNLVTHVRTHHGYRLKDLEVKSPSPKANHAANVATASESTDNNDAEETNNDVIDESGDAEKKSLMKCSHCPREFDSKVSLKTHLLMKHRISSISAKLKCDRCFKTFHRKTGLLSHMRSCGTSVKSRKCPYCLSAFQTYKETVQHKARCPKRYVNSGVQPSAVNSSSVNVTPNEDGTYSCEFCNITFEVQSVFYNHMEIYHSGSLEVSEQQPSKQETLKESPEKSVVDHDTSGNDMNETVFSAEQDGDGKFSCRYCVKSFVRVEDLQDHISYHDINKIFQCKLCFATLNCKRYFQDHMRSHFIQHRGQYLCWTCFKPFNNRRDLTAHKNLHIKLKIYSCNLCKQTFSNILSLERHKRVHSEAADGSGDKGNDESVKIDPKVSDDVIEDVSYNLQEEEQSNLLCHICKKSFSSEIALEKHSKLHNPVKLDVIKKLVLTCSNCKVVFKTSSALRDHLQICKGPNDANVNDLPSNDKFKSLGGRVRCDKCHSSFATKLSLYKHRKYNRCPLFRTQYDTQYGSIKVYYCRYCKRSCRSIFGLYRHLKQCKVMQIKRRAAGVDANHCIRCRKQFSSLAVLFNHEKFCNSQQTGHIPQDVTDGSKLQSLLSRKFKCTNCSTEFHSEESLSRHMKFCKVFGGVATEESSSGERFFSSCNVCGRKFNSSLSYKLHKKFCTGDGMPKIGGAVRCRGCGRPFNSKDRLRLHEKTCKLFLRTPVVMLSKQPQVIACSCGKVFSSSSQLNAHKETCPQQNYEVSSATGSTSSVSSVKSVVKSNVLTCEYCFKKFGKYQARNSHMRICQVKLRVNPKNKKYPYHPKSTASVTITPHIPSSNNPYGCVVCKGTFGTEEELIDHSCHEYSLANNMEINNITVEPDIPQEILDMQPRQPPTQHQPQQQQIPHYLKSPKRVFKCYPCNKIFSGSSALSKHSQLFHGQSPATANVIINADGSARCPKCPRSFRDHKSLTHHMGWHTRQGGLETIETTSSSSSSFPPPEVIISPVEDVQPQQSQFSCSICFRKFLGKGPLQNHMRSHSNILNNQPVMDEEDINSDLSSNVKRPRGNNYRCKICPKVFKDKLSLINHHNLHKTVSPANSLKAKILSRAGKTYVSCNICHKILSSNSIPKHNKLHRLRQERPMFPEVTSFQPSPGPPKQRQTILPTSTLFPCGFCFKLFRHQSSLNDHMIESHSYDEPPIPSDKRQSSQQQQLQQQYEQPVEEDEDDVVLIDEDEPENEAASMTPTSGADEEEGDEGQENQYKCEICDKSWKHRSVYLRHVNAASHKELTKRLSDILTRVNHDVNAS